MGFFFDNDLNITSSTGSAGNQQPAGWQPKPEESDTAQHVGASVCAAAAAACEWGPAFPRLVLELIWCFHSR